MASLDPGGGVCPTVGQDGEHKTKFLPPRRVLNPRFSATHKLKHFSLYLGLLRPYDRSSRSLRNAGTHLPLDTAPLPWKPRISNNLKTHSLLRSCFTNTSTDNVGVAQHPLGTFLKCFRAVYMSCCFVNVVSSGTHVKM